MKFQIQRRALEVDGKAITWQQVTHYYIYMASLNLTVYPHIPGESFNQGI